jgi:hypothetical protein
MRVIASIVLGYLFAGAIVAGAIQVAHMISAPAPDCVIIAGVEHDNHHCIRYCPPDPRECD